MVLVTVYTPPGASLTCFFDGEEGGGVGGGERGGSDRGSFFIPKNNFRICLPRKIPQTTLILFLHFCTPDSQSFQILIIGDFSRISTLSEFYFSLNLMV